MNDTTIPFPVVIPLLNPNEPEALIAHVHVTEGQYVEAGAPLCTLETTKASAEVFAEREGYVVGLSFAAGQTARAGDTLCYLAGEPHWKPPIPEQEAYPAATKPEHSPLPPGLRITQPALKLAQEHNLDLNRLPRQGLITVATVRRWLEAETQDRQLPAPESAFDPSALVIYGGGGHGKALIDLLRLLGVYRLVGIVDDGLPPGARVMGLEVLGGGEVLPQLAERGVRLAVNAVGGIGDLSARIKVFQRLAQAGFVCPAVVHPKAFIESSANLAPGVQVFAHAYIGSQARVGFGCIVNSGAILSHDCLLEEYVNISPGAILAGEVTVGAGALVGMGATVNLGVRIGARARIGNGATVKQDVPEGAVVRAGTVWPPA